MSTLLWVTVPAGLSSPSTARIRVAVVPRLGEGHLSHFGLDDWPALLADASFSLQIKSDSGVHEVDRSPAYTPTADSKAWHGFFDGDAGIVNGWTPKVRPAPEVHPTYSDARAVVTSYRECANILTDPGPDGEAAVAQRIEPWRAPLPPPAEPEGPLPPFPPTTDFHRTVAMLHEHPTVLEALGLVFELSADTDDLKAGSGARFLRVRGTDLPVNVTSPWTKYSLDDNGFWPASADSSSDISGGLLDLGGAGPLDWAGTAAPRWALGTIDVDGAVENLRAEARKLDVDDGHRPSLPALRTAGLMLIRPRRRVDLATVAEVAASRAGAPLGNAEFTADDLTLGYRVDIRVGDAPDWYPLCERGVTYTVDDSEGNALTLGDEREEGHVKPHTAVQTPDGRLHADEVVFRWSGWGPALPPVKLLDEAPEPEPDPARQPPYTFRWSFRPLPGSLPRLRFATRYQMRIRIRDLTGGGPTLEDAENRDAAATDTIFYTRSDPIRPPRLSQEGPLATGAAVDQMVIRSDKGMDTTQFHEAHPQYPVVEQRSLYPPTASFTLAEQHGVFDPPGHEPPGPDFLERTWQWAQRALRADADDDPTAALPDPAASGLSAHIPAAPGGMGSPLTQRLDWQTWPSGERRQLLLTEANTSDPSIRLGLQDDGTLQVGLAKAEEAVLELSSTVRRGYLEHFCVNSWLLRPSDALEAPPLDGQWQVTAYNGRHPLLSPVRRIRLVHAVRTPLADPVWQLPDDHVTRERNDTYAVLRPAFQPARLDTDGVVQAAGLDTDSTGRLEIAATWDEWTNDGTHPRSVEHVHGENIARGDPPSLAIRHEFGDTRHREIVYTLKAISRFRTYFDPGDPDEIFQRSHSQDSVTIRSSARPPDLTVLSTTPSFQWHNEATAGRIEHFRASQRLRVELAGPWYETGEGERLAVLVSRDDSTPAVPVTRLARDPLFITPSPPPFADRHWFAGHSEPSDVSRDLGPSVVLVPYAVTREGDRWYADIEIVQPGSTPSYSPFVQLALARFQAASLPELSLSPVVVSDPVRLLPDRRLIVERDGPDIHLSLLGTQPSPANHVEAVFEEMHPPFGPTSGATDLVDIATPPSADIPAWRPLAPGITMEQPGPPSVLRMPAGTAPLRLRVREVEGMAAPLPSSAPEELRDRTGFVDIILLPAEWRPPA